MPLWPGGCRDGPGLWQGGQGGNCGVSHKYAAKLKDSGAGLGGAKMVLGISTASMYDRGSGNKLFREALCLLHFRPKPLPLSVPQSRRPREAALPLRLRLQTRLFPPQPLPVLLRPNPRRGGVPLIQPPMPWQPLWLRQVPLPIRR